MSNFIRDETDFQVDKQRVWAGVVATDAVDMLDRISVIIPGLDPDTRWEDVRWQARDQITLPKRDDECVLILDDNNELWVVVWWAAPNIVDGKYLKGQGVEAVWDTAIPPGGGIDWYSTGAPQGYLLCDGSAVSRTTFTNLFAAIGTIWGVGNGTTTFNLPDCRGRIVVGMAPGGQADVNALKDDGVALATRRVKHPHTNGVTASAGHNLSLPDHWHNSGPPTVPLSSWYVGDGNGPGGGTWYWKFDTDAGGWHNYNFNLSGVTAPPVYSPLSFPAINGGVSVGIGGSIGVSGPLDGPSYVVANKVIKT